MHKPLEGVRILEWGIYYAAPGAAAILADLGAEVIKIEQPVTGDPFRHADFSSREIAGITDILFLSANRGKKSITIDLGHPKGKQIAYNIVKKSDVFLTNVRRSTVKRMGMDYPTLSKINPKLIYAAVTAYGTKGPDANKGGFDFQGQARSGMMYARPEIEPKLQFPGIIDHSTAILTNYQIVIALLMRDRFGIGQEVDVSLLGTASFMRYMDNFHIMLSDTDLPFPEQMVDALTNHYLCKDKQWLILNLRTNDWPVICELLGRPELVHDPRFSDGDVRIKNRIDLIAIFRKAFAARDRVEWLKLLGDLNLVACAINTPRESFEDPQILENGYVVNAFHPDKGTIRIPGFPIHFSQAEINHNIIAPKLGEHTDSVLKELGGYSDYEIAHFKDAKVI
jgi:crotonobetainyl-CoA:carnitine CoA-transferase CaiB-like acyl-CoA transferase